MDAEWQRETYARFLMLIGGQESPEGMKRARALFNEFKHFFPDAKSHWDAYLKANGLEPVPVEECG